MGCSSSRESDQNDKSPQKKQEKLNYLDRLDVNESNYEEKIQEDRIACQNALKELDALHLEQQAQSKREFYAMEQQAQVYKHKMENFKSDINEQSKTELFAQHGYVPPTLDQLNEIYDDFDSKMTSIFQKYDKDLSGKLSPSEFIEAIPELFESFNLPQPNQALIDGLILTYSKKGSHDMKIKKFIRACEDLTGMRDPDKIKEREIVDIVVNGCSYKGQIKDNKTHGYGKLINKEDIYEGQFSKGEYHGFGIIHYVETGALKYEGQFKKGKISGWGKYYFPNGDYYFGQLKESSLCGYGQKYQKDIDMFIEGQFKDGESNGFTIVTNAQNQKVKQKGIMKNNKLNGYALQYPDGESAYNVGQFFNNRQHGYGKMVLDDGITYEGYFREGNQYGYGIVYVPSRPDGEKTQHGYWEVTKKKIIKSY